MGHGLRGGHGRVRAVATSLHATSDTCVACGTREANPLYTVNGFQIVKCTCGLARTVLPPDFDPASIYTEEYFNGGHRDGYADYEGSGEQLRHEFRRILDALTRHVSDGKLIELGC